MPTDQFLSLDELAMALRVSRETARRAIVEGRVEGFQVNGPGSLWRIPRRGLRDLVHKSQRTGDESNADSGNLVTKNVG